ncbi:MAG: hypothetical protein IPP58_09470 [Holophagaceae bacterium]|uniref:HAMP domain-containing protein n=1 Tax=Candidatus Geothrix skivensis TaxID=2954439 RepID=A0A9D7XGW7_9BACT|nr:hypothetical protein [Candidatus Geothrix skivensis]
MPSKKHRRIVLIDTRFQLGMAGAFILLQLLLTGLFAVALYLFMDSELKAGLASAHAAYRSLDQMLLPLVLVLAGFNLALSTALVTGFVVILSHRIAGPLHRFRIVMEELAERRLPEDARIRPKDQLGVLSESTGRALDTLQADLTTLRSQLARARVASMGGDGPAAGEALAHMDATLSQWCPRAPGP